MDLRRLLDGSVTRPWELLIPAWGTNLRAYDVDGPDHLRSFFAAGGLAISAQNTFDTRLGVLDGKLTFYLEAQGVYHWGCDPDGDDPAVLVREPDQAWYATGARLHEFLVAATIYELVLGAEHQRMLEDLDDPATAIPGAERLTLGTSIWPLDATRGEFMPTRFYASARLLAWAEERGPGAWELWVGAREAADLAGVSA